MKDKELKIEIYGLVQGVNLRRNLANFAKLLGLKGFIRNNKDGSVIVVAQGPEKKLEELLLWVQKAPFPAKVNAMSYNWYEPESEHEPFKIEKDDDSFS